jgi:hypothetical protein
MQNKLEPNLNSYYAQFSVGHAQRRSQLLRSLSAVKRTQMQAPAVIGGRTGTGHMWKSALALAAGLIIVVGAIFYVEMNQEATTNSATGNGTVSINPLSPQEAYASAIERITQLKSLRFVWTTPNGGKDAKVEMWWRRPNDYKMEFASNGLVVASQGKEAITDIRAMFALSQLGRYFLLNQPLSKQQQDLFVQDWLKRCRIVESKELLYKGEKCLKVICTDTRNRYEYIIDARGGTDIQIPFYELKQYNKPEGGKLVSHVEVKEVNRNYADSLFTVE